eukprot:673472-Amphidinium_carterae.1
MVFTDAVFKADADSGKLRARSPDPPNDCNTFQERRAAGGMDVHHAAHSHKENTELRAAGNG